MPLVQEIATAATMIVGYNMAAGKWWERSGKMRIIKKIACVGSTAVADTAVEVYYGTQLIAKVYNSTAGAAKVPVDTDWTDIPADWVNEPNEPIRVVCVDAANANDVCLGLQIQEF